MSKHMLHYPSHRTIYRHSNSSIKHIDAMTTPHHPLPSVRTSIDHDHMQKAHSNGIFHSTQRNSSGQILPAYHYAIPSSISSSKSCSDSAQAQHDVIHQPSKRYPHSIVTNHQAQMHNPTITRRHLQKYRPNENKPHLADDPDSIEYCLDDLAPNSQKYMRHIQQDQHVGRPNFCHNDALLSDVVLPPSTKQEHHCDTGGIWNRNNIAVTMERFQPIIPSPSSPSGSSSCGNSSGLSISGAVGNGHQDYSYAYYEPGAIMCHSNIPTPGVSDISTASSEMLSCKSLFESNECDMIATQLEKPPQNSMRALLMKSKDRNNRTLPVGNRYTNRKRYVAQENIYEDVSDEMNRTVNGIGVSQSSSNEQSQVDRGCTKTEFQHILNNHYRVLEELNLSVEELLMSSSPPLVETTLHQSHGKQLSGNQSNSVDALASQLVSLEMKNIVRNTNCEIIIGEDSGFSGSSSGASYIGSLRNYKTAITRSLRRASAPMSTVETAPKACTIYGGSRTKSSNASSNLIAQQKNASMRSRQGPFCNDRVDSQNTLICNTIDMDQLQQHQDSQPKHSKHPVMSPRVPSESILSQKLNSKFSMWSSSKRSSS